MSSIFFFLRPSRRSAVWPLTALLLLALLTLGTTSAAQTAVARPNPLGQSLRAPEAVAITATKTDTLLVDVDGDTSPDPGDTLRYSIIVANSGSTDALSTLFTDITDDTEVTVVGGSLRATPIGTNDTYTVIGNTHITHPAGTGVLVNDLDPDGGSITASCAPCTTTNGGTVTLNTDGSFTYNPPAGFTGTDSFTYTVTDNHTLTDTGTVTFVVANRIWWVDSDAAVAGTGTSTNPFQTLASAQTASLANDTIFVYSRGANYTAGFVLKSGQKLCGHGANLATCSGLIAPTGTTFPSTSTNPTIVNAAGHVITLDQNNTIQGVTLGNSGGAANFALFGSSFGNLTIQTVTINTNNGGLSLATGSATATFTSITSFGGTNNISLTSVNGNLNLGSGALTGASGNAVNIVGGTAAVSTTATITNTSAKAVNIQSKTGGTVTFGGSINSVSGGTGITLLNNTGATITFAGSMTLNTGTNTAFSATGGGTVSALTGIHTAATTTGTGINLRNMTIGVTGFTFRSVNTNGAANGIYLENNTGTGGFTIVGTGVANSGGTIQNGTGANGSTDGIGIYMNNNTHTVSLNWMQLNDFSNFAIRGITVSSVSLSNTVVSGTNGNDAAFDEGSISFDNLTGTSNITNLTVSGGHEDNFRVVNTSGTLNFSITGSTVRDNTNAPPGNNGLWLQADNTANITANITNSSFLRNRANGIQIITNNAGTMDVTIGTLGVANSGGTFTDNNIGVNIAHNSSSTLNFDVQQATFQPVALTTGASPININLGSLGNQMSGNIRNNTITNANSATGPGMRIIGNGAGTMTILVNGNNVSQIGNRGIEIIARDGSNRINATVTNNTVNLTDPLAADAIRADAGTTGTDTTSICVHISGNNAASAGGFGVRVRQRFAGTTYQLQGYGGGATDMTAVQNFLSTNNGGATTSADFGGGGFTNFVCPTPLADPTFAEATEAEETSLKPEELTTIDNKTEDASVLAVASNQPHAVVAEVAEAKTSVVAPESALAPEAITTIGPFTLPAGEQTTITFAVVIQNPFPAAQNPICNQATISGGNFSNVLSDDPDVGGAANPTCTTVQHADVAITKTDGQTTDTPGTSIAYTIIASNAGPSNAPNVTVADTFPATITGVTWTCVGAGGGTCTAAGAGNINQVVNLPAGGSVTFTANGTIDIAATGTLTNSVTATVGGGVTDPTPGNNSATDTTTLIATIVWDGGGADNNWNTAANWNPDRIPTATDLVIFNGTSSKDAFVNVPFTIYALQVNAGYNGTIAQTPVAFSILTDYTHASGTMVVNGTTPLTVGTAMNHTGGTLRQTRAVNAANVPFLTITDGGPNTRYRGIEVDTSGNGNNLGNVTVNVRRVDGTSSFCTLHGGGSPAYALRCFNFYSLSPAPAVMRFWVHTSELNGLTPASLQPYRNDAGGPVWNLLSPSTTGNDGGAFVYTQATVAEGFGDILVGGAAAPTAVTLQHTATTPAFPSLILATLLLLILTGWAGWRVARRP